MSTPVLDYLREREPAFNAVDDDTLSQYVADRHPELLDLDPQLKARFDLGSPAPNLDAADTGTAAANEFLQKGQAGVGQIMQGAAAAYEQPAPIVESPDISPAGRTFSVGPGGMLIYEPDETPSQTRTRVERNPVYIAGQALEQTAPEVHPVPADQEQSLPVQAAGMAGGFVPVLATGPLAPLAMGAQSLGEHMSSDYQSGLKAGLSEDDAARLAVRRGMESGALQSATFALLPLPIRAVAEKFLVEQLGQAGFARWLTGRAAAAGEGAALGAASRSEENAVGGRPITQGVGASAAGLGASNLLFPWLRETPGAPAAESGPELPEAAAPGPTPAPQATAPPTPPSLAALPPQPTMVERLLAEARQQPAPAAGLEDLQAAMQANQIKPREENESTSTQTQTAPNAEPNAASAAVRPETEQPAAGAGPEPVESAGAGEVAQAGAQPGPAPGDARGDGQDVPPETYLIRHGSTDLNRESGGPDRIRGWIDVPLNDDGRADAQRLADQLKGSGITTIVTSDLSRARETADIVAQATGAQVVADPALRPWNVGEMTGMPSAEVAGRMKWYTEHPDQVVPGGESFDQFKQRFLDAYNAIQQRYAGQTIAITTHFRGTRLIDAWRAAGSQGYDLNLGVFNQKDGMRAGGVSPIGKEPARPPEQGLTGTAQDETKEAAAPETQTGATAIQPETSETPAQSTPAQQGAPLPTEKQPIHPQTSGLEAWADETLERIRQEGRTNVGVDPEWLAAAAVKGAYHIARVARQVALNFRDWADGMIGTFGPEIEPHLKAIWPEALKLRMGQIGEESAAVPKDESKQSNSARFHLARESLEVQRELYKDPTYVGQILRQAERLAKDMDNAKKAGDGLGVRQAGDAMRDQMDAMQNIEPGLLNRVYNELVAKGEIMRAGGPERPPGRTLAELTRWLEAQKSDSPRLTPAQRLAQMLGLADQFNRGKAAVARMADRVSATWQAFLDQYKSGAPHDTDFRRTIKEWLYQKQVTGLETERWVHTIRDAVPNIIRRRGIAAYLDASGDERLLRAQRDQLPPQYRPIWDAALSLTPGERAIADRIRVDFEQKLADGQSVGLIDKGREDYGVPQVWSSAPRNDGEFDPNAAGGFRAPRRPGAKLDPRDPFFALERKSPSYFDGIMAGGVPKDMDIAKLVGLYNAEFHNSLADRALVKDLRDVKDPEGNPGVMISGRAAVIPRGEPGSGERTYFVDPNWRPKEAITKDGRPYVALDHWALRDWKFASRDSDGNPIIVRGDFLVHPDMAGYLKNELGRSWLRDPEGGGKYFAWLMNSAAFQKASKFASATFHMATIGEHALFHGVLPVSKGVELDPIKNPKLAGLMRNGMELGFGQQQDLFEEGLAGHGGVWGQVPVARDVIRAASDFLFKRYIPAIKAKVGLIVLDRNMRRYGSQLSQDQIYELTGRQMNAAFGLQNWRLMGTNKTLLDVNRLFFTAPDFLLSRSKVVAQALKPYGAEQRMFLLAQAATVYLAARALNQLLDGDAHWEPENALSVVYGGRSYSARFLVNDLWNMIQDFRSDRPGWNFISGRTGPWVRAGYEAMTGRDMRTGGRVAVPFETDNKALRTAEILVKSMASWLIPMGVEGLLPGAAGREQTGPGQVALALGGVGSRKYTAQTQVYQWARDYNKGGDAQAQLYQKSRDAEARGESAYKRLDDLLDGGDLQRAATEYQALVDEGHKPQSVLAHYNRVSAPFTGSRARDSQFYQSLSQAQQVIYQRAIQERQERLQAFRQVLQASHAPTPLAEVQ